MKVIETQRTFNKFIENQSTVLFNKCVYSIQVYIYIYTSCWCVPSTACYFQCIRSFMSCVNSKCHDIGITTWPKWNTRSAQGPSVIAQQHHSL